MMNDTNINAATAETTAMLGTIIREYGYELDNAGIDDIPTLKECWVAITTAITAAMDLFTSGVITKSNSNYLINYHYCCLIIAKLMYSLDDSHAIGYHFRHLAMQFASAKANDSDNDTLKRLLDYAYLKMHRYMMYHC